MHSDTKWQKQQHKSIKIYGEGGSEGGGAPATPLLGPPLPTPHPHEHT